MKAAKYLFSLWAGIFLYAVFFVFFGGKGLNAYKQLEMEQIKQNANIEALKRTNLELQNTMNSLLYDRDTLAVYAREQGFSYPSERFIRIVGLGLGRKNLTAVGEVLVAGEPRFIPDKTLIIAAFCTGVGVFIFMFAIDILNLIKSRKKTSG